MKKQLSLAFFLLICLAFSANAQQTQKTSSADEYKDYAVKEVGAIHGGTGPFAIAGYRMGARAMQELERSFHHLQIAARRTFPRLRF